MTTIILTIIGILLAAAAALMVIFYGGDAFNSGSVGAQANTYQNAGTNVIAAVQLAKADAQDLSAVATVADLVAIKTGAYLKESPALPDGSVTSLNSSRFTAEVTGGVDVCARINENLKNGMVGTEATATAGKKMGCFTDATNGETFFANL